MTDREFIQGIIGRNEAVFRELVDCYQQHVVRTCYSLVRDEQDARDLAQEVFIEILESAGSFRGDAKLSSWIYRIAINKSLNHLKQQKRRQFLERIGLRFAASDQQPEAAFDVSAPKGADSTLEERDMRNALHHAIKRLPVSQRIAFTLHKYEELSYREIAAVMDVSVSSVESLLHRAKLNLQKSLSGYYKGNR
jgi:RNA polymerase sigma-70 factor, ECF subfamily